MEITRLVSRLQGLLNYAKPGNGLAYRDTTGRTVTGETVAVSLEHVCVERRLLIMNMMRTKRTFM
jgi:hypothetical protein